MHIDMYPDLYEVVMEIVGFTEESLMEALGFLIDKKARVPTLLACMRNTRRPSSIGSTWPRTTTLCRDRVLCGHGVVMHA
jgi:hypothetical protein